MIRRIKNIIILFGLMIILLSAKSVVKAASISISTSKTTVKPGESFTVTITAKNGARIYKSINNKWNRKY